MQFCPLSVDFVNVMTYDLHGDWDGFADHHAPLHAREHDSWEFKSLNTVYLKQHNLQHNRYFMSMNNSRLNFLFIVRFQQGKRLCVKSFALNVIKLRSILTLTTRQLINQRSQPVNLLSSIMTSLTDYQDSNRTTKTSISNEKLRQFYVESLLIDLK